MDLHVDATGFFRELLLSALSNLQMSAQEPTEHYLVNLLAGYARDGRAQDLSTPFVEQLGRALQVNGAERISRMRCLGDDALFVSGFLQDSCARRGVTVTYCINIGSRAYGEAGRARFDVGPGAEVFHDLSERFEAYTRVLDEVRELTAFATDGELLRLYDRWTITQSPEVLKRLGRRGVFPVKASSGH